MQLSYELACQEPKGLGLGMHDLELVTRSAHDAARKLELSAQRALLKTFSAEQSAMLPAAGQPGQLAQPQWALEECPQATAGQQIAPEAWQPLARRLHLAHRAASQSCAWGIAIVLKLKVAVRHEALM